MKTYKGYKYQQNTNDKWDVMYPENDTKPWVVDFATETILKAWIDEKIEAEEHEHTIEDDITDLQLAQTELAEMILSLMGGAE